jgi:acyl-coenzyme A synthetase/AMP-(fatty) acid ligase
VVGGKIFYESRIDYSVKIHGKRFSLIEVSSTIKLLVDLVQDCVVVDIAVDFPTNGKMLAALIQLRDNKDHNDDGRQEDKAERSLSEIRAYCRSHLSEHMRPFYFLADTLPRNSSGKVSLFCLNFIFFAFAETGES